MFFLGSSMTLIGFTLLWFSPYVGLLTMVIGLGIVWSYEDHKIKKKNEKKFYEQETERYFNRLKFDDPVSPQIFELSTLLYGTIKPHESWLVEQLDELESMYSMEARTTIEETQNASGGKFKNLFENAEKYKSICTFLSRELSVEIYEDLNKAIKQVKNSEEGNLEEVDTLPDLNDILADYDLEEWAKIAIKKEIESQNDRNTIINNVIFQAKKELNKTISVSCLHDEWIINGNIRFKI